MHQAEQQHRPLFAPRCHCPLCFIEEGLDMFVATQAENIVHITKWVITGFPLEFNEDLCLGRVCHRLRIWVGVIDRDVRFDLERKIWTRVTISTRRRVDNSEVRSETLCGLDLSNYMWACVRESIEGTYEVIVWACFVFSPDSAAITITLELRDNIKTREFIDWKKII